MRRSSPPPPLVAVVALAAPRVGAMRMVAFAAAFTAACAGVGCAPLTVQQQPPSSLRGVAEVGFLGAYDARVALGGVEMQKSVTSVGAAPVYGAGGYAGTVYYPTTTTVRTGEIAPNDALRFVSEGFSASVDDDGVTDLSSSAPLETRSEMGMDWFARNNGSAPRYLVSVEVKSAAVQLDDARNNYTLGVWAVVLGVVSPCLACTTAPCLIYPVVAETKAASAATGTLRIYDKRAGRVVHREDLNVDVGVVADGFHDPEEVFAALSTETGHRLGLQAATRVATFLGKGAPARSDSDAPRRAPSKPTPPLDRPADAPR